MKTTYAYATAIALLLASAAHAQTSDSGGSAGGSSAETSSQGSGSATTDTTTQGTTAGTSGEASGEAAAGGSTGSSTDTAPPKPDMTTQTETTATGGAAVSAEMTPENETVFREVIVEQKAEPVEVDIDIAVGTTVPNTVTLHPLPPRIVKLVPAYQNYRYFILADGTIVIVDPAAFQIVYVISA